MKIYLASYSTASDVDCLMDDPHSLDLEFMSYSNVISASLTNSPGWLEGVKNKVTDVIIMDHDFNELEELDYRSDLVWVVNDVVSWILRPRDPTLDPIAMLRITRVDVDE